MSRPEAVILSIFLSDDAPSHNFHADDKLPKDPNKLAKFDFTVPEPLFPSMEFVDPQAVGAVHLRILRTRRDSDKSSGDQLRIWRPSFVFMSAGKPNHKTDSVEELLRDDWTPEDSGNVIATFPSKGIVYFLHSFVRSMP